MSERVSQSDVEQFRSVLERQVGLRLGDDKLPMLARVLASRTAATRSPTPAVYLERVAHTPDEIAVLASDVTVSETYFFRDENQFRAFDDIVRRRDATGPRHLRVLSAGCASGDEPYSIAIAIREAVRLEHWTVSIIGVDLNPEILDRARKGSYSKWALRETPGALRDQYFRREGSRYWLSADLRAMARFETRNLALPQPDLWRPDAFDVVFFRNVLMYFTPATAREVVSRIARSLAPGGYLFLGHAENLRGLSQDFHLRHSHGTFYYERRTSQTRQRHGSPPSARARDAAPVVPASDNSWFAAIAQASNRIEMLSRQADPAAREGPGRRDVGGSAQQPPASPPENDLEPAMDLLKQERFQDALRALSSAPRSAAAEPDALLLRAMLLVSTGDLPGAQSVCDDLLALDELNAGAHYVTAICLEHAGDRDRAVEHSQVAAYLDAEFAMPHLQLGRLARRSGDLTAARRELSLAIALLSREDSARVILFGGGFSRETLVELCRAELAACGGAE